MNKVAKVAAIAAMMAPSFAFAGNMTAATEEADPMMTMEPAGSSAGSLGSAGAGAAIGLGAVALLAIAASDNTSSDGS